MKFLKSFENYMFDINESKKSELKRFSEEIDGTNSFEVGKSVLKPEDKNSINAEIDKAINFLKNRSDKNNIKFEVFTKAGEDPSTPPQGMKYGELSKQRAEALNKYIQQYIKSKNISNEITFKNKITVPTKNEIEDYNKNVKPKLPSDSVQRKKIISQKYPGKRFVNSKIAFDYINETEVIITAENINFKISKYSYLGDSAAAAHKLAKDLKQLFNMDSNLTFYVSAHTGTTETINKETLQLSRNLSKHVGVNRVITFKETLKKYGLTPKGAYVFIDNTVPGAKVSSAINSNRDESVKRSGNANKRKQRLEIYIGKEKKALESLLKQSKKWATVNVDMYISENNDKLTTMNNASSVVGPDVGNDVQFIAMHDDYVKYYKAMDEEETATMSEKDIKIKDSIFKFYSNEAGIKKSE